MDFIKDKSYRNSKVEIYRDEDFLQDSLYTHKVFNEEASRIVLDFLTLRGESYTVRNPDGTEKSITEEGIKKQQKKLFGRDLTDTERSLFKSLIRGMFESVPKKAGKTSKTPDEDKEIKPKNSGRYLRFLVKGFSDKEKLLSSIDTSVVEEAMELVKLGLLPCIEPSKYIPEEPQSQWQSAWIMACEGFASWLTADKRVRNQKKSLQKKLSEYKTEIDFQNLTEQYNTFLEYGSKTENVQSNPNFRRRWKSRGGIRQYLRSNKDLSGQGFDIEHLNLLKEEPYKSLWSNPEKRDYFDEFMEIERSEYRIANSKDHAYISLPDQKSSPRSIRMDKSGNYLKGCITSVSHDKFGFTIRLLDSTKKKSYRTHYVTSKPSRYFQDVVQIDGTKIYKNRKTGVKSVVPDENNFHFTFTKGNKSQEQVKAVVKNINLSLNRYDLQRGRDVKRVSIDLSYSSETTFTNSNFSDKTELNQANTYFATSLYDRAKNRKNQGAVKVGHRSLALDLNRSPLLAGSIFEVGTTPAEKSFNIPVDGKKLYANFAKKVNIGEVADKALKNKMQDLLKKLNTLRHGFKFLAKGGDLDWLSNVKVRKSIGLLGMDYDAAVEWLEDKEKKNYKDATYQRYVKLITEYLRPVSEGIKKIRCENFRNISPTADTLIWMELYKEYINILKMQTYKGKPPLKRGERRPASDFRNLHKYLQNIKLDFLKKVCAEVMKVCRDEKIQFIVMEDLSFKTKEDQDRRQNGWLSLWSSRTILDTIKKTALTYGVHTQLIDPRHTSQLDPFSGEFGRRGDRKKDGTFYNKENLYLLDGTTVDADEYATYNLQKRFWDKYKDIHYLSCCFAVDADTYVFKIEKDSNVRLKSYLKRTTGKPHACLKRKKGSGFVLSPLTPKGHEKLWSSRTRDKKNFYLHEGLFLMEEDHRLEVQKIQAPKQVCAESSDIEPKPVGSRGLRKNSAKVGT